MATIQQSLSNLDQATSPEEQAIATPSQGDVAVLAYAIWEEQGCPHGNDLHHWLQAERTLTEKVILRAD
jgi:hypothetical protein